MSGWWWGACVLLFGVRLSALRRFWSLPLKYGADHFLSVRLGPDVDRAQVAALLGRFRRCLLAPFLGDLVLVPILVAVHRTAYLLHEQFVMMVFTVVFRTLLVIHFAFRARQLAPAAVENAPTRVQLSLAPRRLRDHTCWPLEAVLAALIVGSLLLLSGHLWGAAAGFLDPARVRAEVIWLLYLQLGLLLVKRLFVKLRLKLPAARTEEYVRWRTAWLTYHLRVFDAVRLGAGLGFLSLAMSQTIERDLRPPLAVGWAIIIVAMTAFAARERRRLRAVELAVQPVDLVREFPPTPVAEERFLAGGLFYFNRNSPAMFARSPTGLSMNLANVGSYLWAAYLVGLVVLVVCQVV